MVLGIEKYLKMFFISQENIVQRKLFFFSDMAIWGNSNRLRHSGNL